VTTEAQPRLPQDFLLRTDQCQFKTAQGMSQNPSWRNIAIALTDQRSKRVMAYFQQFRDGACALQGVVGPSRGRRKSQYRKAGIREEYSLGIVISIPLFVTSPVPGSKTYTGITYSPFHDKVR
jgi:hypothetical protein